MASQALSLPKRMALAFLAQRGASLVREYGAYQWATCRATAGDDAMEIAPRTLVSLWKAGLIGIWKREFHVDGSAWRTTYMITSKGRTLDMELLVSPSAIIGLRRRMYR